MKVLISLSMLLLILCCHLDSQTIKISNNANIKDPRLNFVNPAGIGFYHNPLVVAAHTRYYTGLQGDNLADGIFAAIIPVQRFGSFSISGQYFNSYITKRTSFDLSYAKSFYNNTLSIGLNTGFAGYALDQNSFNLIDTDDPLLSNPSIYKLNVGAGLLFSPTENLFIGLSTNHINRPNLTFEKGKSYLEPLYLASIRYRYKFLCPLIGYYYENNSRYYSVGVEGWMLGDKVLINMHYSQEFASIGFGIIYKNLRFDYLYDYALSNLNLISDGTHQFVMSYSPMFNADFQIAIIPLEPFGDAKGQAIYTNQTARYSIDISGSNQTRNVQLSLKYERDFFDVILGENSVPIGGQTELSIVPKKKCLPGLHNFIIQGELDENTQSTKLRLLVKSIPQFTGSITCNIDSVTVVGVSKTVEETCILPIIFFDENKINLDEKRFSVLNRSQDANFIFEFSEDTLITAEQQYKNILNLIGSRLKNNANSQITLCAPLAKNIHTANDSVNLKERIKSIFNYLTKNLSVPEKQVACDTVHFKLGFTDYADSLHSSEMNQVIILSSMNSNELLKPITVERYKYTATDSLLIFDLSRLSLETKVKKWYFNILNGNNIIKRISGNGELPATIQYNFFDTISQELDFSLPIKVSLAVVDENEQQISSEWQIITITDRVERQSIWEKFRYHFFAFDQFKPISLSSNADNYIQNRLLNYAKRDNVLILVTGHADDTGSAEYNMTLSERRARYIIDSLTKLGISKDIIKMSGRGTADPIMDNSKQEGRMFNRRVDIYFKGLSITK